MPRGGKRAGAGRPPESASGAATAMSFKLSPELQERLRAVAEALDLTQAAIVEMGVEAAERKLARRSKAR
jgi:predicted transcriptional regulator